MKYVIGVDAGGTKTEAMAYNLNGEVVASSITGFGNLLNNVEVALNNIEDAIKSIVYELGDEELEGIYIGAAGSEVGNNSKLIKEKIKSQINVTIEVMNDAEIALKAMLKGEDGILTIAGTGSIAFGINNGTSSKCGGWGNLLGDEGSGYRVAICAIQRMIKEDEESLPQSKLTKSILEKLQIQSVNDITEFVYSSTKDDIASITPIVARLGEAGDDICINILSEQGIELAKTVEKLYKKLNFESCSIALVGGVIRKAKVVREAFEKYLKETICVNQIVDDEISPTKGAYYIHMNQSK
ncbi:MAG: ATPase [Clostridium butyricum]|nr:ATPase [Clostridium butyricum]